MAATHSSSVASCTQIRTLGLSYRDAPVEVRQRFALGDCTTEALLKELAGEQSEWFVLSTCNRTEFYFCADGEHTLDALERQLRASLAHYLGLTPAELDLLKRRDGAAAMRHLCAVACGLDSAVLGETEILQQVKHALARGHETSTLGPTLHGCVHLALRCGRRARAETEIASGRVSVASVGLSAARDALDGDLGGLRVMLVGAGKMAQSALGYLLDEKADALPAALYVANRTLARAEALLAKARTHGVADARPVELASVPAYFPHVDLVVTALASERAEPLFGTPALAALPAWPRCVVDLGLPPNVDAAVLAQADVPYIGVDALDDTTSQSRAARQAAVPAVRVLIEEELAPWVNEHVATSRQALDALFRRFSDVSRCESASQASSGLPRTKEQLEAYSLRLVRRLLRPLVQHRDAAESAEALETVAQLFVNEATSSRGNSGEQGEARRTEVKEQGDSATEHASATKVADGATTDAPQQTEPQREGVATP